jgi:hypothetical protein
MTICRDSSKADRQLPGGAPQLGIHRPSRFGFQESTAVTVHESKSSTVSSEDVFFFFLDPKTALVMEQL